MMRAILLFLIDIFHNFVIVDKRLSTDILTKVFAFCSLWLNLVNSKSRKKAADVTCIEWSARSVRLDTSERLHICSKVHQNPTTDMQNTSHFCRI